MTLAEPGSRPSRKVVFGAGKSCLWPRRNFSHPVITATGRIPTRQAPPTPPDTTNTNPIIWPHTPGPGRFCPTALPEVCVAVSPAASRSFASACAVCGPLPHAIHTRPLRLVAVGSQSSIGVHILLTPLTVRCFDPGGCVGHVTRGHHPHILPSRSTGRPSLATVSGVGAHTTVALLLRRFRE